MQDKRLFFQLIAVAAWLLSTSVYGQSRALPPPVIDVNGAVEFWADPSNQIVELNTRLTVPPEPADFGTLFLWPGLQPGGANYLPIDNGVLQPVLTWGPSCAPSRQPAAYSTWWISAQYVNTEGNYGGYTGCKGGPIIRVEPGDTLFIQIALSRSKWVQTIRNPRNGALASYTIDLQDQAQNYAHFVIEPGRDGAPPVADVVFTETVLVFQNADARNCRVKKRGPADITSPPVTIDRGKICYIEKIVLKSPN